MDVCGEITALHGPVIDHREMHEAIVRQQEEIAERVDHTFPVLGVLHFIKIIIKRNMNIEARMGMTLSGTSTRASTGRAHARAAAYDTQDDSTTDKGDGQKACSDKYRGKGEHDRGNLGTEDPEQARDRDGQEQGLLPSEGSKVVQRQHGQGERYEHLEGAALERPFLDPVDLEDRQQECQVDEVAQERPETATAGFWLARIEACITF